MTLGAAGWAALGGPFGADGKKKKTRKRHGPSKKALCLSNGSHCEKAGKKCKAKHCLATPFTIEARWSNPASDHDTYLFVPHDLGSDVPSPYIDCRLSLRRHGGRDALPLCFRQSGRRRVRVTRSPRSLSCSTVRMSIGSSSRNPLWLAISRSCCGSASGRVLRFLEQPGKRGPPTIAAGMYSTFRAEPGAFPLSMR